MSLLTIPSVRLLARSLGLGKRAAVLAVPLSIVIWPEIPESMPEHYGTITLTIAMPL
ncbi:hypothetical protein [Acidilobus sp.]|uniref:hypothetical protein n=1 Tax=Acidilobus sp. TaxID=1872109 RepID=UPI003CFEC4F6